MNTKKSIFGKATSIKTIIKKAKETKGDFANFSDPSSCYTVFNGKNSDVLKPNRNIAPAI